MKKQAETKNLLTRYRNGTCTPEERALVDSWHLQELRSKQLEPDVPEMKNAKHRIWQQVRLQTVPVKRLNRQWLYYAASLVFLVGMGLWLIKIKKPQSDVILHNSAVISPGSNKAVLILEDGRRVVLDRMATGLIANQGQASVSKNQGGFIQYRNTRKNQPVKFNTISIPRGGIYALILSDGTKVWLNSSTTMRYPTSFAGRTRQVEVRGEAYFEVAKNKARPFIVAMSDQKIEVVGTHFNVYAYQEEKRTETTLLEGKILISKGKQLEVLKPGQQAINIRGDSPIKVEQIADAEDAVAWKNGYFISSHESIYKVMNKISRWYDVDIEYRGNFDGKFFGGTISRFKNVKEVLNILELTGSVHFKIEGRRIVVMP
jgi:transmembrane sensor